MLKNRFHNSSIKVIIGVILFIFYCPSLLLAQQQNSFSQKSAQQYLIERGEVIIRFVKPAELNLNEIGSFLSIDNFKHDTVTAYANKDGFKQFILLNIPYSVIKPPSLPAEDSNKSKLKSFDWRNQYPSYTEYIDLMNEFVAKYPNLCELKEFGTTPNGHKLLALKISDNPTIKEFEPVMLYSSTIHGDEITGYILMLRLIDDLLTNYTTNAQINQLVDNVEIWINPLANPDGTFFESDTSVNGAKRFNSNFVDLNRNFPNVTNTNWENKTYPPENVAMMNFMKDIYVDLAANFHGGAEVVNYPWDTWAKLHTDDDWYANASRIYADSVHSYSDLGYMSDLDNGITNGYDWYCVYGSRQDYTNFMLHAREVTIELSNNKMPAESSIENYWIWNRQSLLQYIGQTLTGFSGTVTDSITGKPICAKIEIENHDIDSSWIYSDSTRGIYNRLTLEGNYNVIFSAAGYATKKLSVQVSKGKLTQNNVKLIQEILIPGLFPNPFKTVLTYYVDKIDNNITVEFFDLTGQKIKTIHHQVLYRGKQEIEVADLKSGVYIVNVICGETSNRFLVVKSK
jgi:hypothetical protein